MITYKKKEGYLVRVPFFTRKPWGHSSFFIYIISSCSIVSCVFLREREAVEKLINNFEAIACSSHAQWDVTSCTFPTSRCSDILSVRGSIFIDRESSVVVIRRVTGADVIALCSSSSSFLLLLLLLSVSAVVRVIAKGLLSSSSSNLLVEGALIEGLGEVG